MKIIVEEKEGQDINLQLPTGLVLNGITAGVISRLCEKNGVQIPKEYMKELIKEVKKYKKEHPEWTLVEVCERNGDRVEIKL